MNHQQIRQTLAMLAGIHGRHTGLISLYVPRQKRREDVLAYLTKERAESVNIKDKVNRNAVLTSINALAS